MKNNQVVSYALGILFSFCLMPDRDPSDHICGGGDLLDSGLL